MLRRFVDRPDLCNKIEEASASSVFAPPSANLGNLRDVAAEGDKARGSVRISLGHQYLGHQYRARMHGWIVLAESSGSVFLKRRRGGGYFRKMLPPPGLGMIQLYTAPYVTYQPTFGIID